MGNDDKVHAQRKEKGKEQANVQQQGPVILEDVEDRDERHRLGDAHRRDAEKR